MLLSMAVEVVALRGASHVNYEVGMLRALPPRCAAFDVAADGVAVNACLEACLGHARALIEFLGGRKGRPTDIRAEQYAPSFAPSSSLSRWVPLIDRHLAHLSWARALEVSSPQWDLKALVDDVVASYGEFVAALDAAVPSRLLLETAV